jgi:hypothetical protein
MSIRPSFTGIHPTVAVSAAEAVSLLAVSAWRNWGGSGRQVAVDRLCAELPRLLAEEVAPEPGRMLGNAPLVWSHAAGPRTVRARGPAQLRDTWDAAGVWAWRLYRYLALRHQQARHRAVTAAHPRSKSWTLVPTGQSAASHRPGRDRGGRRAEGARRSRSLRSR